MRLTIIQHKNKTWFTHFVFLRIYIIDNQLYIKVHGLHLTPIDNNTKNQKGISEISVN